MAQTAHTDNITHSRALYVALELSPSSTLRSAYLLVRGFQGC